jgi:hypothetical protein
LLRENLTITQTSNPRGFRSSVCLEIDLANQGTVHP